MAALEMGFSLVADWTLVVAVVSLVVTSVVKIILEERGRHHALRMSSLDWQMRWMARVDREAEELLEVLEAISYITTGTPEEREEFYRLSDRFWELYTRVRVWPIRAMSDAVLLATMVRVDAAINRYIRVMPRVDDLRTVVDHAPWDAEAENVGVALMLLHHRLMKLAEGDEPIMPSFVQRELDELGEDAQRIEQSASELPKLAERAGGHAALLLDEAKGSRGTQPHRDSSDDQKA